MKYRITPLLPALLLASLPMAARSAAPAQSVAPAPGLEMLLQDGIDSAGPKTMQDLSGSSWKRLRLGLTGVAKDDGDGGGIGGMIGAMFGGAMGGSLGSMVNSMVGGTVSAGDDVYYTRGRIVQLGSEYFLLAYKPKIAGADSMAALKMLSQESSKPPAPPKPISGATPISLTMINLHTVGTVSDIRPFDLASEIAASKARADEMAAMANAKNGDSGDDSSGIAPSPKPAAKPHKSKASGA